ncbi:MAG TPA: cupin domain-containing protein [Chloroflexota bacterium]|nr:cupin domain-containing protein [Chloroflexota bacterium]
MAKAGDVLTNPYTETLIFRRTTRDTGGELVEVEAIYRPGGAWPPEHYHPKQEERFEVTTGTVQVRRNGRIETYQQGESFVIPAGVPHTFRNASDVAEARVIWQTRPALKTERFFETAFGLARDGKTDEHGVPSLLQALVLADDYAEEFRLTHPPYPIQRIARALIAPLGRLLGYRGSYPQ